MPIKKSSAGSHTPREVARLVDVARDAGVSVSTAGRVLRKSHLPVAPAVAQKVRDVAKRLGYVPNLLARNLRGSRPRTIGLVVGDMLDPYYGTVAEAVTERAESEHGLLAVVCNIQRDPSLELKYCQQLWEHRVAGLILAGGGFDQHLCARKLAVLTHGMQASGLIVCTLGPRLIRAPMFCVDNEAAGRMAAAQLLAAGHRRIGVVNGNARSETGRLRLAGSLAGLREAGIAPHLCEVDYRTEAVAAALHAMLAAEPQITGILATSDFMSTVTLEWLQAHGIAVPQAMSVVGIRGTDTAVAGRRLTSVDVQIATCSRAALDYIAARSEGQAVAPPALFAATLRTGETLAPLR
ncbi:Degradation activator [Variovorax sp. PBL-H6]|uniref:LacI family DNA-binding transcriptional regulator n=1 Tax=Variovorax sp. PBL-H6 TaxID=434009 RepID=UPI00131659DB|nr:LacI family DNA-binding transcriptional regulator [Variovorax sp. PBL-H6]VTU23740.1 Degradation activator [Variovorax sp. PBL-H6]